ncbi:MAG: BMP family ABC transporter substrate-binding protein [Oscillospiraceae bacterium]|nr:BMP family ABC transporter substrate-binding protein [Oscillospiraceae bacterium]
MLYYKEAVKYGQKEYRLCVGRGEYPYLPALADLLPEERISAGTAIGAADIPTERIVGTRSAGRVHAFARNFMPLMPETSEFASKWTRLCEAHLEEGIRDPVKVYEYMNRYYVAEGNKRVSILKFFDAPTVGADITRVWPQRDGDRAVELYYEQIALQKLCGVGAPEFSRPGSCAEFVKLMGRGPEEVWDELERRHLSTLLHQFRQAYLAQGGGDLRTPMGDALLVYLRFWGLEALDGQSSEQIKPRLAKLWEEIALLQEPSPLAVKLDPAEERRPGLLNKVVSVAVGAPAPLRAAFLHDKAPERSAWTASHEAGRARVQEIFSGEVETRSWFDCVERGPAESIAEAVAAGYQTIFTTSPVLLPASLRAAVEHPEITVFNCSVGQSHRYIRTYYPRMYEAKFIIGAVAGSLAGGEDLGYVCDYPIYGQVAGVNAFALGAQMVNPRVRVDLEWSSVGGAEAAVRRLRERGVSLISCRDLLRAGDSDAVSFGLSRITDGEQVRLAIPHWRWDVYYEAMLRRLRTRQLSEDYQESPRALHYYWGMNSGVVDVECAPSVSAATVRLVGLLRESISNGTCQPFRGPLFANDGKAIEGWQGTLSVEQIIGMDWLNENVVGAIPAYDELSEIGKATVDMVGVEKVRETKKAGPEL